MKNILKVFIITAGIVLLLNVNSYAIVDGAVWGGDVFNGSMGALDIKPTSWQYGAKAHLNTKVMIFELGLGGYFQNQTLKYDYLNSSDSAKRKTIGIDANVILNIPLFPINPYVRGTYNLWDKISYNSVNDTEKMKGYGIGAGLELSLPVIPVRIFAEYMYDTTEHTGNTLKNSSASVGVKVSI